MSIFISRNVGGHFSGLTVAPPEETKGGQMTCQACNAPAGAGHVVRLRDLHYSLIALVREGRHEIQEGRIGEAVPLCRRCVDGLISFVWARDTHLGQEENSDDE